MQNMKIAYLVTRIDEIGGAQIHVRDMAFKMADLGHSVIILSAPGGDAWYINELKEHNVKFIPLKKLKREINFTADCMALKNLCDVFKKIRPDILSLHSSKAGFLGRIAGFITGTPTLFTAHGWSFSEGVQKKKAYLYAIAEKMASYFVKKIINVCHYDKKLALNYGIAPSYKLKVIHNGVYDVSLKLRAKTEMKPCRMVMTARFAQPKDHVLLLSALEECTDLPWHLDLIGSGPLESGIKDIVKRMALNDRITFHGQIHGVAEILSSSQIFVLITNWEGLPRSIIEALRAGLPVVASNVGGIAELVEHEKNGFLISRADTEGLAKYLRLLLTDVALRTRMGKESRRVYEKEFTFETMYKKTRAVYDELLYS
jgi:glycosyltransferase involved in cell wall biosynthesis